MSRTSGLIACCVILTLANLAPVQAQVKTEPINVVHAGIDRLYADLDYVFGLANEKKELDNLKKTLDVFFVGVDTKQPSVVRLYVRKGKFNSVLYVPTIGGPAAFRGNIRALGVKTRQMGGGMFGVSGLFNGFLKEAGNISIIAEDRNDTVPVPGGNAAFKKTLDPNDNDFMASIVNDAAQLKDRENAIEDLRKQVLPGLKQLKIETPEQFELRKLTIDQQLTELKQAYAEAKTITSITNLDPAAKTLVSSTELVPLPDTELYKSIDEVGKEPSYFANIARNEKEPLSASINLKLDALRQKHVKAFLQKARPLTLKELTDTATFSDKTKEYVTLSAGIIFDVLEKGTADGLFDSFINLHTNESGLHTLIGGTRVDGAIVKAGLEKLKDKAKVELDASKIGDVTVHKVTLPEDLTELHDIYGKDLVLLIGTSPKAVWYALGEKAEDQLKSAIEKVGEPAPASDKTVVFVHAKAHLWFKLFDAFRTKHKLGKADDRQIALDALKAGDDEFNVTVEKTDAVGLKTTLTLKEGILRYFGKVGAKFVKENLQN